MSLLASLRAWARRIKRDGLTLWFATRHPDTPWAVKLLGLFVVAYALSPIDLIPDFVPILGYLDDVVLLPALIWLGIRWLPNGVLTACRGRTDAWLASGSAKPTSRAGALIVVAVWIGVAWWAWRWWRSGGA